MDKVRDIKIIDQISTNDPQAQNHNKSWLDLLSSSCSSEDSKTPNITIEDCDAENSRELEIEFADSENEKKFDKLLNEKKIKSPFKRRLSNEKLTEIDSKDNQIEKKTKIEDEQSPTKRLRKDSSESSSTGSSFQSRECETNLEVLDRRQKQIDYGKNTIGYDNYISQVPKLERTRVHPKTPPRHLKYSRRAWEGLVKSWRRKLHVFDPKSSQNCANLNNDSSSEEI